MADDTAPEEIIKQGILYRWTRGVNKFKAAPTGAKANKHALKKKKKQERSTKPDKKERWQPRVFTLTKNSLVYESEKDIEKKNKKLHDKDEQHYVDETPPQHDVVSKRKTHAWWHRLTKEQKRTCFFDPVSAQVSEVQPMEEMDDMRTNRFFFQIKQGSQSVHLLQATTIQDRQAWVEAINWVLGFHCKAGGDGTGSHSVLSESSDEEDDDVSRPSYAFSSATELRPGSPRNRTGSSRHADADWENELPRWALPDDNGSGNGEDDDDQLARDLAKEFMQRLQTSNMSLHNRSPSHVEAPRLHAAPKSKIGRRIKSFEWGTQLALDRPAIAWQYLTSNGTWEDYKKRDTQLISQGYYDGTVIVDLGKWMIDLGKMNCHSKSKSSCRPVRGLKTNGKLAKGLVAKGRAQDNGAVLSGDELKKRCKQHVQSHKALIPGLGSSTVHKQGMLYRKTDIKRSKSKYVPRLFTLTDGSLQYSHEKALFNKKTQRQETKKRSAWKRTMNLQRVYAVTTTLRSLPDGDADGRFFFEVKQPDRSMKLFATSADDRTDWLNCIAAVVDANCRRVGYTLAADAEIRRKTSLGKGHDDRSTHSSEDDDDVTVSPSFGVF